jgi:hypothetical protein
MHLAMHADATELRQCTCLSVHPGRTECHLFVFKCQDLDVIFNMDSINDDPGRCFCGPKGLTLKESWLWTRSSPLLRPRVESGESLLGRPRFETGPRVKLVTLMCCWLETGSGRIRLWECVSIAAIRMEKEHVVY